MCDESVDLVARWRQGDADAANELYERYCERLMRVVSARLQPRYQSQFEPEDVLQSAFRTVFRRITEGEFRFEDDSAVWKLLVTVVLNKLRHRVRHLNAGRRDVRREQGGATDFDGQVALQLMQPPGVEEAAEFEELMSAIFGFLPEQECKILQLRMEGYSQKEIAEQLELSDRQIRRILERIRDRISMLLEVNAG